MPEISKNAVNMAFP